MFPPIPCIYLKSSSRRLAIVALAISVSLAQSEGQVYHLVDGSSTADINVGSSQGMYNWSVQGQNELNQQWFWYQVGNQPGASIDRISAASASYFNGTRGLTTTYTTNDYAIRVDYLLGGGPAVAPGQKATSDIGETITIYNT